MTTPIYRLKQQQRELNEQLMLADSLSRKAEIDAALSRIEAAIEDYMEDRFDGRGQDDGDLLYYTSDEVI